jgi:DNA-binding transcriptional ArsR family regulator
MKQTERILKALANRRRLEIVMQLRRHPELCVQVLAARISLSTKATSKHLHRLYAVDVLDRQQRRREVYYRIAQPTKRLIRSVIDALSFERMRG